MKELMSEITSIAAANKQKNRLMKHDDINTQNTVKVEEKENVEQLSNEESKKSQKLSPALSSFKTGTTVMKKFHIINVNSVNQPVLGKLDYPAGSKEWLQKETEKLAAAVVENQIKPNSETGAAEKLQIVLNTSVHYRTV